MSGWIKMEKSLLTDMRFRRMVDRYVEQSNALRNAAVTVMLGALAQLWLYADDHIHDDDTVRATTDDIDQLVGVDQFCSMVPKDWLVVLNPDQIQLPDFLVHNGTSARSRKLNAERQARFRHRHGNGKGNGAVTHSNARNDAKLDQTRPDQNKTPVFDPATVPGLDLGAWLDWLGYRKKRKPAIKPESMQKAAEQMAALGPQQRAAVDHSIANGYQGLIEPNGSGKAHQPQKTKFARAMEDLDRA
jgi:hypothetical protein